MIYLGSDHGGFDLKERIKRWLDSKSMAYEDLGNTIYEKDDDYPDFAFKVAEKVSEEEKKLNPAKTSWQDRPKGIISCRSAAGMVIAANKVKGGRCAAAFNVKIAEHSRLHNDTNILALSEDFLDEDLAIEILEKWLSTEFSHEDRHKRRIDKISGYETIER